MKSCGYCSVTRNKTIDSGLFEGKTEEQRDAGYLDAVGSLIESVARVEVARGDRTVRFDKRALTTLELAD